MVLLDHWVLGIAILFLLGMLVAVKRFATGSVLDRPQGNALLQLVNIFNLFFLLIVNPLAARQAPHVFFYSEHLSGVGLPASVVGSLCPDCDLRRIDHCAHPR